jgi:tight adherence protein B
MTALAGRPGRRRLRRLAGPPAPTDPGTVLRREPALLLADRYPLRTAVLVAVVAAVGGYVSGGPVAGVAGAVYATIGVRAVLRRRAARRAAEATTRALDAVAALAADLRAGAVPDEALAIASPALGVANSASIQRLAGRVGGAWQVAEAAGAPLADLLDRLAADARGLERIRLSAAAHAAGAAATTWLLAALPVAGIAIGYGIGADPLQILLGTPVGAACAGVALTLQLAGLAWSARLTRLTGDFW